MCMICVEYQKQIITMSEVRMILSEMQSTMDQDHLLEIEDMLRTEREYDDT